MSHIVPINPAAPETLTPILQPTPRAGRVMLVFSRPSDARDVSRWLVEALDLDLTVVRDARVAASLLRAAGRGRYRAIICEADLRGGSGLELLSQAKSLDPSVTSVLVSRFRSEVLNMDELFFVDHHVPAGLPGERMTDEVLRALGLTPGSARRTAPSHGELLRAMPLPPQIVDWPFGRTRERTISHSPVPPAMGPVSWGNELGASVVTPPGGTRRLA